MSSTNSVEPPSKKKKKKLSTETNSILSLPDDLIVSCLARVSRLHYPLLSLVSKSFRSVLASPELYQTRNFLNLKESCLYVCLSFPDNPNPCWFTLCKKPNQTLTKQKKDKSSGYVLAPISILNSPTVEWSDLIEIDSNLYAISTEFEGIIPCTNLSYLDCRTHTWLEAPRMRISHTGTELDGEFYLPGSNEIQDSSLKNIQVFNTETQTWKDLVPSENRISKVNNMEGMILSETMILASESNLKELTYVPDPACMCMIDNIIYSYHFMNGFKWSITGSRVWKDLEGLDELPSFSGYTNVNLVDYGGKMIVLWDECVHVKGGGSKEKTIWCAEISIETSYNDEEIWGKVEWFDEVLTVPKSYKLVYFIDVTI